MTNDFARARMVACPASSRAASMRDGALLAVGLAAMAGLLASCGGGGSRRDSGVISSGLDALAEPGTKQPKLNRAAEIKRDADESNAYAKLADQATLDLNALLEARGRKKSPDAATRHHEGTTGLAARNAEGNAGGAGTGGSPPPGTTSSAPSAGVQQQPTPANETPVEKPTPPDVALDSSWANDPNRTIPQGERPRAASRFAKDAQPGVAGAADATREAISTREPKMSPTAMTANLPPEPAPAAPVFKGVRAALCTRVTGFGKLEAMPIRKGRDAFVFPAARVNRAIVYVELENFGYRAAKPTDPDFTAGDAWAVELSTEIQLLDDPDSILQFKERERTVIETGRNKRRDFYLVQEIELPPTLTVGAYNLKLILRDKSGGEPVRSEVILPVQIVADMTASAEER